MFLANMFAWKNGFCKYDWLSEHDGLKKSDELRDNKCPDQ